MVWWPWGKKEEPVLRREDRQQCWDARDAYFACLDQSGVVKAGEEKGACVAQESVYAKNCAKSWVIILW